MNPLPDLSGHLLLVTPTEAEFHADQPASALGVILDARSCLCTRVDSPVEALRCLRKEPPIDLVIIIPGASFQTSTDLCRNIKLDVRSAFVPVVFVLPAEAVDRRLDLFRAGADDCIQLPASAQVIKLCLLKAIRAKHATDSLEDANAVITALAMAIEGRDPYTCGHVERVATYSVEIGKRLGVDAQALAALRRGGVVHDIGKVAVPDHILNKPGKLTDVEMAIIQRHPIVGHDILRPLRTFRDLAPIIRWHHERPNGTGYPDGLKGDDLPLLPRIVAVADCFDAISTNRPYRPALPIPECRSILSRGAENGDLDGQAVATLLGILEQGPALVGSIEAESGTAAPSAVTIAPNPA